MSLLQSCVVINLDRRPDRLASITTELENIGLSWFRMSAVDGRQLDDAWAHQLIVGNEEQNYPTMAHRKGVVGCALSHRTVIELAKLTGLPHVFVLEDDARFHPHFLSLWASAVMTLPEDWQLLRLCTYTTDRNQEQVVGPWYRPLRGPLHHATGYIAKASVYDELIERFSGVLPADWAWIRWKRTWGLPVKGFIEGAYHHMPLLVSIHDTHSDIFQRHVRYGILRDAKRWTGLSGPIVST